MSQPVSLLKVQVTLESRLYDAYPDVQSATAATQALHVCCSLPGGRPLGVWAYQRGFAHDSQAGLPQQTCASKVGVRPPIWGNASCHSISLQQDCQDLLLMINLLLLGPHLQDQGTYYRAAGAQHMFTAQY